MWSIGEFARLGGVSVRMLRHYDALGLLVPEQVTAGSGHRRYSAAQLPRLNRLIALKELGFSLEQVGAVLDADPGPAELRAMLTLRRAQVSAQIAADRARLGEIERRLRSIEKEGLMSELEFVRKPLPAVRIAQLAGSVTEQPQIAGVISPLFDRLVELLTTAGQPVDQPTIAWYAPHPDGMELGAAVPTTLATPTPALAEAGVEIATLAEQPDAVTVLHRGGMEGIGDTWQALARYVEDQGLTAAGPCREVYLHLTPDGDPADWITELQQPVA